MFRKKISIVFGLLFFLLIFPKSIFASEKNECDYRYLTLINPVRGRNLWLDKTLKPLDDQYQEIEKYNFSATWLLQYDALIDKEITNFIKNSFNPYQEIGLFLEVSPDLAWFSRVVYPPMVPWYEPQVVFLSGYSQSQRRKLIDTVFVKYKEVFGTFPTSIGAWWLDSYSLTYIKNKYGLKAILIVADQKTTDNYGVWGQWWGVPYYPSKANVLTPAKTQKINLGAVVLQWAQRDFSKAFKEGSIYSNYSLQANDYTERGLDTSYFKKLINNYLDCSLPIGQITVGLETGIESVKAFTEYQNQLKVLAETKNLKAVTMTEFADYFQDIFPSNPKELVLKDETSEWVLTPQERENKYLKEKIMYDENLAFGDYFVVDKSRYLARKLPININKNFLVSPFLTLLGFFIGLFLFFKYKLVRYYGYVSLFILISFLTTFLDYSKFGRLIYFGPVFKNILISQFLLVVVSFFFFVPFLKFLVIRLKNKQLLMVSLSLSFFVDFIVSILRYTQLQGQYYFGFAWDSLRFVGLKIAPKSLAFVNQDFSPLISGSLLKFDFNIIWENKILSLFAYPLVHLVLGILIYLFLNKLPQRGKKVILAIIFVFFCLFIYNTVTLDPRIVF